MREHPGADVVVAVRPSRSPAEEHAQAVRAAVNRLGLEAHHVELLLLADGLRVDAGLELPPRMSLGEAHRCRGSRRP